MQGLQFLPLLVPPLFFVGLFFLVKLINKQVFKDLLSRFDVVTQIPEGSIRPEIFRFGNSILRNSVSLAEEGDGMVVKIMMIPAFKIPYATFSSIQQDKNVFTFKFKEEQQPIYVVFRPDQVEKFPRLKTKVSSEASSPVAKQAPSAPFKPALIPPTLNTQQIKSSFGNIIRGLALVALLLGVAYYAHLHWGIF